MATHLSARLAWHMDGWNGHICTRPGRDTICVGPHSYPGDKIGTKRDLAWEESKAAAGRCCSEIDGIPPCIFSINAFGSKQLTAADDPPEFFGSGSRRAWRLPSATVCTWPYEVLSTTRAGWHRL